MAYFVVVPAFVLWLLMAAAALVATRAVPRLTSAYSYVLRISIWGTVGFVGANALLICLLALGFGALERTESSQSTAHDFLQMAWGLAAIGGPVIASGLGWIAGCILGAALAFLRGRRLPHSKPLKPTPQGGAA
jgi:hypothetical protein